MWRGYKNNRYQARKRTNARNYRLRIYRHVPYRTNPSYHSTHENTRGYDKQGLERVEPLFLFNATEESKSEAETQTDGILDVKINQLSQELLKKNAAIRNHDVLLSLNIRKLSVLWIKSCRRKGGRR